MLCRAFGGRKERNSRAVLAFGLKGLKEDLTSVMNRVIISKCDSRLRGDSGNKIFKFVLEEMAFSYTIWRSLLACLETDLCSCTYLTTQLVNVQWPERKWTFRFRPSSRKSKSRGTCGKFRTSFKFANLPQVVMLFLNNTYNPGNFTICLSKPSQNVSRSCRNQMRN
jgi:hypothetical protein